MLIMLRCNKDMWSEKTLQDIIDSCKEDRPAAEEKLDDA
jgi:hypothetical protein